MKFLTSSNNLEMWELVMSKSVHWFIYDRNPRHERVKVKSHHEILNQQAIFLVLS